MATEELLSYIKESQKSGTGEAEIKKALKEVGWQDNDVEDAFRFLAQSGQINTQQVQDPGFKFNLPTERLNTIKRHPYFKYILGVVLVIAVGFTLYKVFRNERVAISEFTLTASAAD